MKTRTRANWFLDEDEGAHLEILPTPGCDVPMIQVQDVGVPISLETGEARLREVAIGLVREEAILADNGVTCSIRNRSDTCCSACPLAGGDPRLTDLCRVGRQLEQVVGIMAAQHEQTARAA